MRDEILLLVTYHSLVIILKKGKDCCAEWFDEVWIPGFVLIQILDSHGYSPEEGKIFSVCLFVAIDKVFSVGGT